MVLAWTEGQDGTPHESLSDVLVRVRQVSVKYEDQCKATWKKEKSKSR